MKFVVTLEQQQLQGKNWQSTTSEEYMVRFPNYMSPDHDEVLNKFKAKLEKVDGKVKFVVTEYHLYADNALTASEKTQLDLVGDVKNPPIEISI